MTGCLLIGPPQQGGEGAYVREIYENPPDGVTYSLSQEFHQDVAGAKCNGLQEILLNRLLRPHVRYGFGFRVLTLEDEIDLVHIHSHPTKIYSKQRVPIVMSAGSSHYVYVKDYEMWSNSKIKRVYRLARTIYRPLGIHDELLNADNVARIYTLSNWAREIYGRHGVPLHKVDVIPPGFEVPPLPESKDTHKGVRFLFVGREFARKGGPVLLEAFKRLKQQNKNVFLTIVTGDVDQIQPTDGVEVLAFMDRTKLYNTIYPAADVFVMPTEAEGWGFTNAEAMSFALPVISTNINAIPEIIEDGRTGILIRPRDGDALVAALSRLADSRELREEMGQRAREHYIANFSRDVFRKRLREFYDTALRS